MLHAHLQPHDAYGPPQAPHDRPHAATQKGCMRCIHHRYPFSPSAQHARVANAILGHAWAIQVSQPSNKGHFDAWSALPVPCGISYKLDTQQASLALTVCMLHLNAPGYPRPGPNSDNSPALPQPPILCRSHTATVSQHPLHRTALPRAFGCVERGP